MKPWIKELTLPDLRKQLNIHVNKLWQANITIKEQEAYIESLKNRLKEATECKKN